jgi:hypothetical protein
MAIVTIDVTQKDIENGQGSFHRTTSCPVYQAASRVIPNLVRVGADDIVVDDEWGDEMRLSLPYEAKEFIKAADIDNSVRLRVAGFSPQDPANLPLKPFTFFIRVPDSKENHGQTPILPASGLATDG